MGRFSVDGLHVHMIGIGGCGMSGAARILLGLGGRVSGSDMTPFDGMGELVAQGATVHIGHAAAHLPDTASLVVISAAIPYDNPELLYARERELPVLKYAELLGIVMDQLEGVAVAGTHGKTTTTAMCAHLFRTSGLDPSFVFGATSVQLGGGSGLGKGPHLVAESCEFDRSFLHLRPRLATILNIEPDHLDCYRDIDDIVDAFGTFASHIRPDGILLIHDADARAHDAARRARVRVETFGFTADADWRAVDPAANCGCYSFEIHHRGRRLLQARLAVAGKHNVLNALAAAALAHHAGAAVEPIAEGLSSFAGVHRRMTLRGKGAGVIIVDDYAHHPTEIRATLEAARGQYQPRRLWVVFQPHQYARTKHFMDEFAGSFGLADEIIIPDVYGARETDRAVLSQGSEELVFRILLRGGHACYMSSLNQAIEHLIKNVTEGDLVMTMGAGDVWKVADELVARICR
ncbi:MAG: UDP-N-acetylmuramate--L-alanine ligase [Phycisphaerae bacterium]|nr:UDP-N-acetylmuramate--L-alanine ligase [Phycisphaerae bacterium]